jgi:hypothetical protein
MDYFFIFSHFSFKKDLGGWFQKNATRIACNGWHNLIHLVNSACELYSTGNKTKSLGKMVDQHFLWRKGQRIFWDFATHYYYLLHCHLHGQDPISIMHQQVRKHKAYHCTWVLVYRSRDTWHQYQKRNW